MGCYIEIAPILGVSGPASNDMCDTGAHRKHRDCAGASLTYAASDIFRGGCR